MTARLLLVALAGLAGAAGVALGAIAAHRVDNPALPTAAQMLVLHAAAAIAVAANLRRTHHRPVRAHALWVVSATLMLAGAALFAGDIAMRALAGARLFPMAAPTGGSTMILGWLLVAAAAIVGLRGREK